MEDRSVKEEETKLLEPQLHVDKKPRLSEEEKAPIEVPESAFRVEKASMTDLTKWECSQQLKL